MCKKITYLSLIILTFGACQNQSEGYRLDAQIDALPADTKVYLSRLEGLNLATVDSALAVDQKVSFEGVVQDTTIYFLSFENTGGGIPFFLENTALQIKAHVDSLYNANITGSQTNIDLMTYRNASNELNQKGSLIFQQARNLDPSDTIQAKAMQDAFEKVQEEADALNYDFVKTHPDSYASLFVLFDIFSFETEDKFKLSELYYSLNDNIQQSLLGNAFRAQLERYQSLQIGAIAPDFIGPSADGGAVKLSQVKGAVTVLDFWASWCVPCRAENPRLAKMYEDLKDKGLEIVSVSLDRDGADWREAIKKDGMKDWHHVSNLMFWEEPIAREYNVLAIPQTFVLDENLTIIASDLRGEGLEAFVRARFQ
jgi:thiol-disulfide isomerase/thioredoxin